MTTYRASAKLFGYLSWLICIDRCLFWHSRFASVWLGSASCWMQRERSSMWRLYRGQLYEGNRLREDALNSKQQSEDNNGRSTQISEWDTHILGIVYVWYVYRIYMHMLCYRESIYKMLFRNVVSDTRSVFMCVSKYAEVPQGFDCE